MSQNKWDVTVRLGDKRKKIILEAAIRYFDETGLVDFNWKDIEERCKIKTSISTIRYHFPKTSDLSSELKRIYKNYKEACDDEI